jgi:hypothetical protein
MVVDKTKMQVINKAASIVRPSRHADRRTEVIGAMALKRTD